MVEIWLLNPSPSPVCCRVASPKPGNYGYLDETETVDRTPRVPPAESCARPPDTS
ncbi:Histone acetyltransferase KAT6A, partial [Clarias magur]